MRWISVIEQKPEPNKLVLAYFPEKDEYGNYIGLASYNGEILCGGGPNGHKTSFVATHWRELPEPPNDQIFILNMGVGDLIQCSCKYKACAVSWKLSNNLTTNVSGNIFNVDENFLANAQMSVYAGEAVAAQLMLMMVTNE